MTVDEWDEREVCPDGTCVGVIGSDGLCKVCGRAATNWGNERKRGMVAPEAEVDAEAVLAPDTDEAVEPVVATTRPEDVEDYEWSRRKLCPDDTCVGVLGANNQCKVCGRGAA